MNWIASRIKWVMLVSGVLTFTMIYAAFAPTPALQSAFGESLEGPLANIVVRNWGALIALVGAMLVYGAFRPAVRPLVLAVAGVSKLTFISLVLTSGRHFMSRQLGSRSSWIPSWFSCSPATSLANHVAGSRPTTASDVPPKPAASC